MSEVTEVKDLKDVKHVHSERKFVTAEMARQWLKLNVENNRPIQQSRVNEYARDMRTGKWKENGETIKFSTTGKLIDGQTRLTACMECGVGFWSLIAYGVDEDAFLTIDRGQQRSQGQMLHMSAGISDYNAVAATTSLLYRFRDGIMLQGGRPTAGEVNELLMANPGLPDSVAMARRVSARFKAGPVPAIAICHYLFSRQDATLAEVFFDSLASGASLREIDPVYQLRSRIISSASTPSKRIGTHEFLALMCKTWIAEREQRTMKVALRWSVAETFPNIGPVDNVNKVRPDLIDQKKSHPGLRRGRKKVVTYDVPAKKVEPQKPVSKLDKMIMEHESSRIR